MPKQSQPPFYRCNAVKHDDVLRMRVPSRTKGQPPYLVQLDSYGGNGTCQCKHFATRLEPILKRGITPEEAFVGDLVDLPEWSPYVEDALRCFHIITARIKFADDTIRAIKDAQALHSSP